jgi:hypothetical protein
MVLDQAFWGPVHFIGNFSAYIVGCFFLSRKRGDLIEYRRLGHSRIAALLPRLLVLISLTPVVLHSLGFGKPYLEATKASTNGFISMLIPLAFHLHLR